MRVRVLVLVRIVRVLLLWYENDMETGLSHFNYCISDQGDGHAPRSALYTAKQRLTPAKQINET